MDYFKSQKAKVRMVIASIFIFIGILHFTHTGKFVQIVPPFIPAPKGVVYVSGILEIVGGLGLLTPRYQEKAAFGLVLLLIVVFPANIYMAVKNIQLGGIMNNPILQWVRLPLQAVFIWCVLWCVKKE